MKLVSLAWQFLIDHPDRIGQVAMTLAVPAIIALGVASLRPERWRL